MRISPININNYASGPQINFGYGAGAKGKDKSGYGVGVGANNADIFSYATERESIFDNSQDTAVDCELWDINADEGNIPSIRALCLPKNRRNW